MAQLTGNRGKVYLVGAGPGEPGLVTVRGGECLRQADVVLYDSLVSPLLLGLAPLAARLVCLGQDDSQQFLSQEAVQRTMIEEAVQGRTVVRLMVGDPMVFGRCANELAALRAAGIPYEVVAGVAAMMVGPGGAETSWPASRPLSGARVLVTRPRDQAEAICRHLIELGADVLVQPAITISDPPDWRPVDDVLDRLDRYDWVVFSSANGVRKFLDRLGRTADLRRLGQVRIAAIGPGTADELARYRLRADRVPPTYRAEALAASLAGEAQGRRFLLIRASRGREVLAEHLLAAGAEVEQVVVYTNTDVAEADPQVAAAMAKGEIDWVTVTSSTIGRSLVRLFGERLRKVRIASISPLTSDVLRGLGYPPAAEATDYTLDGVVQAIVRYAARTK